MSYANDYGPTARIRHAMQAQFCQPNYTVIFEVPNEVSARQDGYCDALVMSMWRSQGLNLDGFEFKVSRSDWLRELKNFGKSAKFFDYCDRWYLVTPADIEVVKPGELPQDWGHMRITPEGKVTVPWAAKKLEPTKSIDRGFLAAIMRAGDKAVDGRVRREVEARTKQQTDDFAKRVDEEATRRNTEAAALLKIFEQVKGKLVEHDRYHAWSWISEDHMAAAIVTVYRLLKQGQASRPYIKAMGEAAVKIAEVMDLIGVPPNDAQIDDLGNHVMRRRRR